MDVGPVAWAVHPIVGDCDDENDSTDGRKSRNAGTQDVHRGESKEGKETQLGDERPPLIEQGRRFRGGASEARQVSPLRCVGVHVDADPLEIDQSTSPGYGPAFGNGRVTGREPPYAAECQHRCVEQRDRLCHSIIRELSEEQETGHWQQGGRKGSRQPEAKEGAHNPEQIRRLCRHNICCHCPTALAGMRPIIVCVPYVVEEVLGLVDQEFDHDEREKEGQQAGSTSMEQRKGHTAPEIEGAEEQRSGSRNCQIDDGLPDPALQLIICTILHSRSISPPLMPSADWFSEEPRCPHQEHAGIQADVWTLASSVGDVVKAAGESQRSTVA